MWNISKVLPVFIVLLMSQSVIAQTRNGFDVSNSLVDEKLILQGGPPRDSIPSINEPSYVNAGDATFLRGDDIILGIKIDNKAFAFARHILNWHEIVNDEVSGKPFVITYCPLCGSGMAFSSKVRDKELNFGVSGLLYNNDLVFYDKETDSLWSQIERRAISGPMAGVMLEQLVLDHTTWQAWLSKHPDTLVLSDDQGFKRNYRHDPYTGYDTSSQLFFKTLHETPKDFHTKERVLGISISGAAKAYPFSELNKNGKASFQDELADTRFTVRWDSTAQSATLESELGEPLASTVAFWFAWYNFHPTTGVFRAQ
jgi:hypothetical protein